MPCTGVCGCRPYKIDKNEDDVTKVDAELGTTANFGGFNCKPQDFANFARHYWGYTDPSGRRFIRLQLVRADYPGPHGRQADHSKSSSLVFGIWAHFVPKALPLRELFDDI